MKYFTSDNHFYHISNNGNSVITLCNRPYKNINEMHSAMIKNWNSVVTNADEVFVVGDFGFFKNAPQINAILDQLHGTKHLILGNHDSFNPFEYVNRGFTSVHTSLRVKLFNDEEFIMNHDPSVATIQTIKNRWLVGHVHNLFEDLDEGRVINVGVDVRNFTPISEHQIIEKYPKRV